MSDHFIFGYGSLVHRGTHDYSTAHPARLQGWRRAWRHTTRREVAFLNVIPDAEAAIDGLILSVPEEEPELAAREYAYGKVSVTDRVSHSAEGVREVNLWAINDGAETAPNGEHALLLSYIDVVVGGYLAEFGEQGVADFFATTVGWDAPVWNDRARPIYPRAQETPAYVRRLTDKGLDGLPCWIEAAPDMPAYRR